MNIPLLQTKLYVPHPRPDLVARPRLIKRLDKGLGQDQRFRCKLTLIAAPAGFGKTTLVSEWLAGVEGPAAWLSLDDGDNDAARFLAYLVAALQTVFAGVGAGLPELLQSRQPPSELFLTSLINEIAARAEDFILVLDDYHLIQSQPIDDALTFLLDHMPPRMHLVITTREDPNLPLTRLRARSRLTELRAADLRFTPNEAATFLNQVMGLNLSPPDVTALENRTEGWIAGLQMAALSMQGRADAAGFIQAFTGSHRFIIDYLVEEVLQNQSERVRTFLLQTAILSRLSGPLCDAVTGQEDGRQMLEALERSNLFVVPLDDKRQWYRYHHLFADVLQAHLIEEQPDQLPALHQRASQWCQQHDWPAGAIHHAFAAKDFERAAALVEMVWPALLNGFQPATWLGWVRALPNELVRARPVLNVGCAWALLDAGELEGAETSLRSAEKGLDAPAGEVVVVNEAAFQTLPASIASARAYLAQAHGDVLTTIKQARRALGLFPQEEYYQHGIAALFLGLAYWAGGKLEAAYQAVSDSVANMRLAGNIYFQVVGIVILGNIKTVQGRLREAASLYEQSLQFATEQSRFVLHEAADLYVGLSALHRERDELEAAAQHLETGKKEMSEQAVLPGSESRWYAAMAQIKAAQGDMDSALDLLHRAEILHKRDPFPDVRPAAALKARMWIRQGSLAKALEWAHERGLSADDNLSYMREFEHITLARVMCAQYQSDDRAGQAIHTALTLLERLLNAAEEGNRAGSVIEILVVQALARQTQGDTPAALASLERALKLAEPEGYVRIFVDEGSPMAHLLSEAAARRIAPDYTRRLLAAFGAKEQPDGDKSSLSTTPSPQPLIEPLSPRELDVLRLLKTELSGPEIARELMVALSTVRTHTKNIYGKLSVNNRRAAVNRATELDLI